MKMFHCQDQSFQTHFHHLTFLLESEAVAEFHRAVGGMSADQEVTSLNPSSAA